MAEEGLLFGQSYRKVRVERAKTRPYLPKTTQDNNERALLIVSGQVVNVLIKNWLDDLERRGKSTATIKAYRRGVNHFVRWIRRTYEEPFDPAATIARDVEDWKTYQQTTEKSAPATINQRLVAVSRFFAWALDQGVVQINPAATVKAIRLEKHKPRGIKDVELRRLMRAIRKQGSLRDIAIIELLAGTGLRVGELIKLQIGDINLGKRAGTVIVRHGKQGNFRTIPLTKHVRQALNTYLGQHPDTETRNAPLWLGARGALSDSGSVARILDKYAIQAQLPKITPHQLRHTFARRYLEKNPDDLRGLAALLGHSNLNTVMIYTEPTLEDLVERMERTEAGK